MIHVLSRAQMRDFDAHAIHECKVPSLVLMENAGRGAADIIERELSASSPRLRRVVVVAGTGNNGGDGFVVARHLLTRGARVEAWLIGDPAKMTPDCRANHDAFRGVGGVVSGGASPDLSALMAVLSNADIAVDALFGTGLDRPVTGVFAEVIGLLVRARHEAATVIAALDVPSGLDAETGSVLGVAAQADVTVSFAHLKLGHATGHGASRCGPVHVVDIGVPPSIRAERSAELVEASDVRSLITARDIDTHKYRAGHVGVLAGSPGKIGAALLAATAALRGGAGATTIFTWPEAAASLESRVLEIMVARLDPTAFAALESRGASPHTPPRSAFAALDSQLASKRAVVVGPGFGLDDAAKAVVRHVIGAFHGPVVVDADGISAYAGAPEELAVAKGRAILTPHTGELARLLGMSADEVSADRYRAAREAARRTGAVVLLKGAYTIVAAPEGRVVVSGSGSPALATAGSGDVLAGLIGALACTLPPFEAAYAGAFLHGVSGRAWEKEHGDRGMLASEIAEGLPAVLSSLVA